MDLPPDLSLGKKESPVNPYNRADWTRMNSKWPLPDTNDNEISGVNSLQELDCGAFLDAGACYPREIFDKHDTDAVDSSHRSIVFKDDERCKTHWARNERYQKIKAKVGRAIKRHKIFLIRGELPKLKETLEKRGWVQKHETTKTRALPYGRNVASLESRSLGDLTHPDGSLNEKAVIFAMLRHKPPDFIWDCRNDFVDWHRGLSNNTILNRYQKPSVYTSKLGMARSLEEAHWLYEEDVSSVLFPRSYNLSREPKAFLDDFRLTAAAGLLKWFVERMQNDQSSPEPGHRPILTSRLEFAMKRCEEFIAHENHQNIDKDFVTEFSEEEWNSFLDDYAAAVHEGAGIEATSERCREQLQYLELTNPILAKLKEVDPQYELNGMRNIWILKPSELCCGTGISISHNLKDIYRKIKSKPKDYFIVQKYIERPLLIQDTKFDIRQWYLVTNTFPMTIWVFKEGLLRFSSKPYTFSTYHEAIHICNTAIQEKYDEERRRRRKRGNSEEVVKSIRDQGWDCEKLNEYLKQTGHCGEPYYDRIYPKMSEAIVLTMLASQEHMDRRRCSFELYGADFVVMEDLSVWLIEINTNPRMHPPSSRITKRLYSNVLESLVKATEMNFVVSDRNGIPFTNNVIMDVPMNPSADTGGFSLAYKQNIPDFRPYLGPCLFVFGKSITLQEYPRKRQRRKKGGNGWVKQQQQQQQQNQQQTPRAWTTPPLTPPCQDPGSQKLKTRPVFCIGTCGRVDPCCSDSVLPSEGHVLDKFSKLENEGFDEKNAEFFLISSEISDLRENLSSEQLSRITTGLSRALFNVRFENSSAKISLFHLGQSNPTEDYLQSWTKLKIKLFALCLLLKLKVNVTEDLID
ncbi:Tubulin glycylase 3A [Melipona quadrifasciata]|uniref:Tubulin glycylase 3A n=1 Tax=Melipona quadrifasciata TaxID=166423 RepID=A0A0M9A3V0_9HYME|nr:Tubulin glycylase 3A [Melipona quadrifasciata]